MVQVEDMLQISTKTEPRRSAILRGSFYIGLLTLALAVKPFAYVAGNHTRCDRQDELEDILHYSTSSPLAGVGGKHRYYTTF